MIVNWTIYSNKSQKKEKTSFKIQNQTCIVIHIIIEINRKTQSIRARLCVYVCVHTHNVIVNLRFKTLTRRQI